MDVMRASSRQIENYQSVVISLTMAGLLVPMDIPRISSENTQLPFYRRADIHAFQKQDDISWYFTAEWQAMEDEADADFEAARNNRSFDSVDDFLASL